MVLNRIYSLETCVCLVLDALQLATNLRVDAREDLAEDVGSFSFWRPPF